MTWVQLKTFQSPCMSVMVDFDCQLDWIEKGLGVSEENLWDYEIVFRKY